MLPLLVYRQIKISLVKLFLNVSIMLFVHFFFLLYNKLPITFIFYVPYMQMKLVLNINLYVHALSWSHEGKYYCKHLIWFIEKLYTHHSVVKCLHDPGQLRLYTYSILNNIFCVIWLEQISLMLFCWGFIFARKDDKCFIIDFINPINLLWSKISANFLYKAFSILKNYNIMRIFLLLRKYAIHIVMIDEGCNPILVYVIEPGAMS